MEDESKKILIGLTGDEALVLFELLGRFSDREVLEIVDQAEERALWRLHGLLEKQLVEPFKSEYGALLEASRMRLRDPSD